MTTGDDSVTSKAMDTLDTTQAPAPFGAFCEASQPQETAASTMLHRIVDGLAWHIRESYADLLEEIPSEAWFDLSRLPAATLIKENGERQVWRIRHAGGDVYAKITFTNKPLARIKRWFRGPACLSEWRAAEYARECGLPAVQAIGYAHSDCIYGNAQCILLTAGVANAIPLNEYWKRINAISDAAERNCRIHQLIPTIANLIAGSHQAGLCHVDLHPENLLVTGGWQTDQPLRVLFVDLQNVNAGRKVSDRDAVRNLAQLNQWFRRHASVTQRIRFLRAYIQGRVIAQHGSPFARRIGMDVRQLVSALDDQAARHAREIHEKRDRRAMRNNKYFARIRLSHGWKGHVYLCAKHAVAGSAASTTVLRKKEWLQWLKPPEELSKNIPADRILKDSHSSVVWCDEVPTSADPIPVVCKRTRSRNWRRRLSHLFRPSRNLRTWRLGHALLHREIPTARPLAVLERRHFGLLLDSIVITEKLDCDGDLEAVVSKWSHESRTEPDRVRKDLLIRGLCLLIKRLHARGFAHRDFKAANILIASSREDPSQLPRISLVDLDGLSLKRLVTEEHARRAIARLSVSLEPYAVITRTDRLRFLKLYLAGWGCEDSRWKTDWKDLAARCDVLRRRHLQHQQWKLEHYGRK